MKAEERLLIDTMNKAPDANIMALLLETFIQEYGPLSEEAGEIVRNVLEGAKIGRKK